VKTIQLRYEFRTPFAQTSLLLDFCGYEGEDGALFQRSPNHPEMFHMNAQDRIGQLSDREVEACLQGVLKGFVTRSPEYASVIRSSDEISALLRSIAGQVGDLSHTFPDDAAVKDPRILKLTLGELASDSVTGPWVTAWLDGNRPTLLEPITTAIVLASIVMLLSTHAKVEFEKRNGKTSIKVHVEKKPTAKAILARFFKLF
jgi:hypothetical protein